jgi:hypothetical protein
MNNRPETCNTHVEAAIWAGGAYEESEDVESQISW